MRSVAALGGAVPGACRGWGWPQSAAARVRNVRARRTREQASQQAAAHRGGSGNTRRQTRADRLRPRQLALVGSPHPAAAKKAGFGPKSSQSSASGPVGPGNCPGTSARAPGGREQMYGGVKRSHPAPRPGALLPGCRTGPTGGGPRACDGRRCRRGGVAPAALAGGRLCDQAPVTAGRHAPLSSGARRGARRLYWGWSPRCGRGGGLSAAICCEPRTPA